MSALVHGIFLAAILYVIPLLGRPRLLADPRILLLVAACVVTIHTQHAVGLRDAVSRQGDDRFSYLGILLAGAVGQWVAVLDWAWWRGPAPLRADLAWVVPGTVLLVVGLAWRIRAIRVLGKFFTATVRVRRDQQVIRSGPYRVVRHPSYLGALVATAGGAVRLHSPAGLATVLVLMTAAYVYRIRVEEGLLDRELGAAYADYRRAVRWRLLPGLW